MDNSDCLPCYAERILIRSKDSEKFSTIEKKRIAIAAEIRRFSKCNKKDTGICVFSLTEEDHQYECSGTSCQERGI